MYFSKPLNRFGDEIFAALNEKRFEREGKGLPCYNLSVGTPDFLTPPHVKQALIDAAQDQDNWKYSLRDMPELKQAVCDYYERRFGVAGITPDMVQSCNGTQEGMGHLAMCLADEGDTVILPTPCYPLFISAANICGAEPYYYPLCAENNFLLRVSDIPEEVARNARFIIVSFPSNPVGSTGTAEVYREVIEWAKKYDVIVIHDNAYSDIIFDGAVGGSFLQYPGAAEVGVEFFSLSKSFNVTGARISFLVGNPQIVGAFRKLRSHIDFGMFAAVQKAAIACLTGPLESVKDQCKMYEERRDALCGGFRAVGWDIPDSHGTMFVWAKIPEKYKSSMEFCLELIEKAGFICTPGSSFGPLGEGYVRMALVLPPEKMAEAVASVKASGMLD